MKSRVLLSALEISDFILGNTDSQTRKMMGEAEFRGKKIGRLAGVG